MKDESNIESGGMFERVVSILEKARSNVGTHPAVFVTCCVTNSAGFMPSLGWSHYRVLMRVENADARTYYEREAAENNWSVRQLERQIHSLFFEQLRKSSEQEKLEASIKEDAPVLKPVDIIKDPYVLEFLDLPESPAGYGGGSNG